MDDTDRERLYRAFCARDPRFDGKYFVGVRSTGIYCRPVCHARKPKKENCEFFASAAEAEKAGYRPCLQCRPELAPGCAPVDACALLAQRAARCLRETCGSGISLAALAESLGCSPRHLRRTFEEAYQVRPVEYLTTCRLLLAKSLLTDTRLPVTEIAFASGFRSLRRFNEAFRERYRLAPTALRKQLEGKEPGREGDSFVMALGYRPPFRYDLLLEFWNPRLLPGIETIQKGIYSRGIQLTAGKGKRIKGWFQVRDLPARNRLELRLSASLLPVLPQVLSRVHRLFDLDCEPQSILQGLEGFREATGRDFIPGIRIPGCPELFEMGVRAILGQQISTESASRLAGRLADRYGAEIEGAPEGIRRAFPLAEDFFWEEAEGEQQLGPLGIIRQRARAIVQLAAFLAGRQEPHWLAEPPEQVTEDLQEIPGIGPWTAHYTVMRALGWTDAFPVTDLSIRKALAPRTEKEREALAEAWRPWRSYATLCLWQGKQEGVEKNAVHHKSR